MAKVLTPEQFQAIQDFRNSDGFKKYIAPEQAAQLDSFLQNYKLPDGHAPITKYSSPVARAFGIGKSDDYAPTETNILGTLTRPGAAIRTAIATPGGIGERTNAFFKGLHEPRNPRADFTSVESMGADKRPVGMPEIVARYVGNMVVDPLSYVPMNVVRPLAAAANTVPWMRGAVRAFAEQTPSLLPGLEKDLQGAAPKTVPLAATEPAIAKAPLPEQAPLEPISPLQQGMQARPAPVAQYPGISDKLLQNLRTRGVPEAEIKALSDQSVAARGAQQPPQAASAPAAEAAPTALPASPLEQGIQQAPQPTGNLISPEQRAAAEARITELRAARQAAKPVGRPKAAPPVSVPPQLALEDIDTALTNGSAYKKQLEQKIWAAKAGDPRVKGMADELKGTIDQLNDLVKRRNQLDPSKRVNAVKPDPGLANFLGQPAEQLSVAPVPKVAPKVQQYNDLAAQIKALEKQAMKIKMDLAEEPSPRLQAGLAEINARIKALKSGQEPLVSKGPALAPRDQAEISIKANKKMKALKVFAEAKESGMSPLGFDAPGGDALGMDVLKKKYDAAVAAGDVAQQAKYDRMIKGLADIAAEEKALAAPARPPVIADVLSYFKKIAPEHPEAVRDLKLFFDSKGQLRPNWIGKSEIVAEKLRGWYNPESASAQERAAFENLNEVLPSQAPTEVVSPGRGRLNRRGETTLLSPEPEDVAKIAAAAAKEQLLNLREVPPKNPGGIPIKTKVVKGKEMGQYQGRVNLTKFQDPKIAAGVMDTLDEYPTIAEGTTVTHKQVASMAKQIKAGDAPAADIKALIYEPGRATATVQNLQQQAVDKIGAIADAATTGELENLGTLLQSVAKNDLGNVTRARSEAGRIVNAGKIPVEQQRLLADQLDKLRGVVQKDAKLTPVQKKNLLEQIKVIEPELIGQDARPGLMDKLYYIWINGLVSGPKTMAVNAAGNTIHLLSKVPDRMLETVVDKVVSLFSKKRDVTGDEVIGMIKGITSKEHIPEDFSYTGSKAAEEVSRISPLKGSKAEVLEPLMFGTRALAKTDSFYGNFAARMEYHALKDKGYTALDLKNAVLGEAEYRTFTEAPPSIAKALLYNKKNVKGLRWFIPFVKTAANIIKQAADMTPAGLYGLAKEAKAGTLTQRALVQRSSRMIKGAALGLYAYNLWKDGRLTGDAPKDPAQKKAFLQIQKKQENAIKVGDTWVPLANFEPVGSTISIFANVFEGMKEGKENKEGIGLQMMDGIMRAGVALGNKRYLAGVTNLINAASDPQKYGMKVLAQPVSGFVPGWMKAVTDTMDTTVRSAKTPTEMLQRRLPWESQDIPAQVDVFGDNLEKPSGLNLFNLSSAKTTGLQDILRGATIQAPQRKINGTALDSRQYEELARAAGRFKAGLLKQKAAVMRTMPDDQLQYFVNQISNAANNKAKIDFIRRHGKEFMPKPPFQRASSQPSK